jgi:hypothetical protein
MVQLEMGVTHWMLTHRRNWFLERVLKLGLTMIAKEYQCVMRLYRWLSV